jgi:hypothetical protein
VVEVWDADVVDSDNADRQWPKYANVAGYSKAQLLARELRDVDDNTAEAYEAPLLLAETKASISSLAGRPTKEDGVILSLVDNDRARLAALEIAERVLEYGAVILAGCDRRHGQVVYGMRKAGEWVHDPRSRQTLGDGPEPQEPGGCNLQEWYDNGITGHLVGRCLEHILSRAPGIHEWYWKLDEQGLLKVTEVSI